MFSSEEQETTEKTVALCDSSQAPDSDPALQMSKSQEVSEPSACSPRKGAQLSPSLYLIQIDKASDVTKKLRKGWAEERIAFCFLITLTFPCFIWLSAFIKTSCLPRLMSGIIKARDSSTCGSGDSTMLCSDYALCFRRAAPMCFRELLSVDFKRDDTEKD